MNAARHTRRTSGKGENQGFSEGWPWSRRMSPRTRWWWQIPAHGGRAPRDQSGLLVRRGHDRRTTHPPHTGDPPRRPGRGGRLPDRRRCPAHHRDHGAARPHPGRPVVDAVEDGGTLWTVTDWIDGTPLGQLLAQQGTFHYVRAARIGLELLDILEAAHSEGITHGELSPGQVFVRDQGGVVLTGFGLAGATLAPRITAPSYASPEQARDERIGPAADLWALGAILYTLVEGHPPFRDRGRPEATLKGVDRLPMRGPSRAGPLAQIVQGLLRKNSRERLTRPVVRESLTRILTDDPYADREPVPLHRLRRAYDAVHGVGTTWSGRGMAVGTALAVGTVTVAVLAATHQLPGTETSAATSPSPLPSASATVGTPGDTVDGHANSPSATPSPTSPPHLPRPPPHPPRAPPPRRPPLPHHLGAARRLPCVQGVAGLLRRTAQELEGGGDPAGVRRLPNHLRRHGRPAHAGRDVQHTGGPGPGGHLAGRRAFPGSGRPRASSRSATSGPRRSRATRRPTWSGSPGRATTGCAPSGVVS